MAAIANVAVENIATRYVGNESTARIVNTIIIIAIIMCMYNICMKQWPSISDSNLNRGYDQT